ncbi:MAG: response regulator, partial [Candidatus Omnitrophica bacterium]|nr:response regulator [Candidatus Omnitrophota bacterium]
DFYQKIDLIIIDFLLPGMNGDKIIRFLKFNNKTKSIPIILITSRTIFDTIKKSELLNVDFLIFKPFTFDQLDEVIKKIFEKNGASVS